MGLYGLMAWELGTRAYEYALSEKPSTTEILYISYVPFMFVAAVGSAVLCLVLVVDFARSLTEAFGRA